MNHRQNQTIGTGTYRVRFAAHCGLGAYDIATGCDRRTAIRELVALARRRRATGHPTDHVITTGGLPTYEFSEPDDCALIPDSAGLAWIEEETARAVACGDCGELVRIGETCGCHEEED